MCLRKRLCIYQGQDILWFATTFDNWTFTLMIRSFYYVLTNVLFCFCTYVLYVVVCGVVSYQPLGFQPHLHTGCLWCGFISALGLPTTPAHRLFVVWFHISPWASNHTCTPVVCGGVSYQPLGFQPPLHTGCLWCGFISALGLPTAPAHRLFVVWFHISPWASNHTWLRTSDSCGGPGAVHADTFARCKVFPSTHWCSWFPG